MKEKSAVIRFGIIALGVIVLVALGVTPTPEGLSWAGKMSLGIFVVAIVF